MIFLTVLPVRNLVVQIEKDTAALLKYRVDMISYAEY